MDFFTSEIGSGIAWICTVIGFIYGFIKSKNNRELKVEITNLKSKNQTLNNNVDNLTAEIADFSNNDVTQNGEKNVQTNTNTGGMTINM
ncbi:MAG: hypothetical protein ACI8RP_000205 [Urechidicola sp.]|jgi:uncharacterized protein YlxW (UPF0749 family)